jgi:GTP-binding protein EngB required for normal cell division
MGEKHAVFDIQDWMFFSWFNAREIQMSIAASKLEKIGHHMRREASVASMG